MATATASVSVQTASRFRAKYFLFGLIGLMLGYVLVHNESFLIHPQDPIWQHYHPFRWYLLPHGLAGAFAPPPGPMQVFVRPPPPVPPIDPLAGRKYLAVPPPCAPLGDYI